MGIEASDSNREILKAELEPIKQALAEIAGALKTGGGPATRGSSGPGGRSALAGGSAKRGRGFGGSLKNKLLGKAPFAAQAGAAVGGAVLGAIQPLKKIASDTVFNGLRLGARFGTEVNPFTSAFNSAKALFSQGAADVADPIKRAAQRTNAVTALIARGGGKIDDPFRQLLFNENLRQENLAQKETKKVELMSAKKLGSEKTSNEMTAELLKEFRNLADVLKAQAGV